MEGKMKSKAGSRMILIGGILELFFAMCIIAILVLYLRNSSEELLNQIGITPKAGLKALFLFYAYAIMHLIAAIIAIAFKKKPDKYLIVLIVGCILLAVIGINNDWANNSILQNGFSMLPGALIAGGAILNKKNC